MTQQMLKKTVISLCALVSLFLILSHTACEGKDDVDRDDETVKETTMPNLEQDSTGQPDTFRSMDESSEGEIPLMPLTVSLPPEFINEGEVLLRVHSNATGVVDTAWIIRSSGYPEVDSLGLGLFLGEKPLGISGMDGEPVNVLLEYRSAGFFERFIQDFGVNLPDSTD